MSQGTYLFTGGQAFELTRLNRALTQLARPASSDEWLTPMTPAKLFAVGVFSSGRVTRRQDVIERLWGRKRQLLRQASAFEDWETEPPVA